MRLRRQILGALGAATVLLATGAVPELGCVGVPADGQTPTLGTHVKDWRDEVIYQVIVDRFADGDVNNDFSVQPGALARYQGGDWLGLEQNLGYIQTLGATTIWISPVVKNVFTNADVDGYHGYWAQDLTQVNPYFGDLASLRSLVASAHARGMKVVLDIVCNHLGQLFFYDMNLNGRPDDYIEGNGMAASTASDTPADPVVQFNEYDPDYDVRGVQAFSSDGNDGRAPIIFLDNPATNQVPPEPAIFQQAAAYHGRGHILNFNDQLQAQLGDFTGGLKDLNTEYPPVEIALEESYENWVTQVDFDGFRIDTIKHIDYPFWNQFLPTLRQHLAGHGKKNFYVFGESFDGDDALDGSYTIKAPFDGIVYFPQLFQVYDGVFANATLGNQSGTAVIQQLWEARDTDYSTVPQAGGIVNADGKGVPPTQALLNFIDNHDVGRFLFSSQGDKAALLNALTLNFTAQGVPCVYYGTEQDFSGGNDPANREVLWTTGFPTSGATFKWIQSLTKIRAKYPALRHGTTSVVWASNDTHTEEDAGIFAFERLGDDSGDPAAYALVVLNTNATATSATLLGDKFMTTSQPENTVLADVLGGTSLYTVGAGGALKVTLPPQSAVILIPRSQL